MQDKQEFSTWLYDTMYKSYVAQAQTVWKVQVLSWNIYKVQLIIQWERYDFL